MVTGRTYRWHTGHPPVPVCRHRSPAIRHMQPTIASSSTPSVTTCSRIPPYSSSTRRPACPTCPPCNRPCCSRALPRSSRFRRRAYHRRIISSSSGRTRRRRTTAVRPIFRVRRRRIRSAARPCLPGIRARSPRRRYTRTHGASRSSSNR